MLLNAVAKTYLFSHFNVLTKNRLEVGKMSCPLKHQKISDQRQSWQFSGLVISAELNEDGTTCLLATNSTNVHAICLELSQRLTKMMIKLPLHANILDMSSKKKKNLFTCYLLLSASFLSYILSIFKNNFPCTNSKGQTNIYQLFPWATLPFTFIFFTFNCKQDMVQ